MVSAPGRIPGDIRSGGPGARMRLGVIALLLAAEAAAIVLVSAPAEISGGSSGGPHRADRALVIELRLTGLALWPEAGYCRQPALSDLFTPHAFHPASPDLLPAGSMVPPHPWAPAFSRTAGGSQGEGP